MRPDVWPIVGTLGAALIVAVFGWINSRATARTATTKATADANKSEVDAVKVITETTLSLILPLNESIAKLTGDVSALGSKVASLESDNRDLRRENSKLRTRVVALEGQITGLGHTPVNGTATVIKQTTETTTVTEQQ